MIEIPKEQVKRAVRTNLETIVLSLLLQKPTNGYKMMQRIYWRYGVKFSTGTFYPALYKLKGRGLVKILNTKSHCKIYGLTPEGAIYAKKSIKEFINGYKFLVDLLEEGG